MENNDHVNERVDRGRKIEATADLCPFVGLLREQCYCTKMTSLTIQKVLAFCAGSYRDCDVYSKLTHIDDRQEWS